MHFAEIRTLINCTGVCVDGPGEGTYDPEKLWTATNRESEFAQTLGKIGFTRRQRQLR